MNDLISKQDAISLPVLPKEHRKQFKNIDDAFESGWKEALSCVNMLPSASNLPGKWIKMDEQVCNECGYNIIANIINYCPNCGAKTRYI